MRDPRGRKSLPVRCDEAAQQRAAENTGLVYRMVEVFKKKTGRFYISYEDAVGVGMIALVRAAAHPKFDPKKAKFSTYAGQSIWNALTLEQSRARRRRVETRSADMDRDGDFEDLYVTDHREKGEIPEITGWLMRRVRPKIEPRYLPMFDLWSQGLTAVEVAARVGRTRNRVLAVMKRFKDLAKEVWDQTEGGEW